MKTRTLVAYFTLVLAAVMITGCGNSQSRKAAYFKHGQQYFAAGNYDKAGVEFRNAAQIDPRDANVTYMLGQLAEKTGDLRAAVASYGAAIAADPKLAPARAALGRLYLYGGATDKALELVQSGLQSDPNDEQLLTVRGAARQRLGDVDAALADALAAQKIAPTDTYATALLASIYRQRSQQDTAIQVVQQGLALRPADTDLITILASLYLEKGRVSDAEAQLKKIIALKPQSLQDRYRLARFYLQQKNTDGAEQTVRDAVSVIPSDEARLQLVNFLMTERNRASADQQIDQFLAKNPDDDRLKLALAQLLVANGEGERGETLYQSVIAHAGKKNNGLIARDLLANRELSRGDTVGAQTLAAEVLAENQRDNGALLIRGQIELGQLDYDSAIGDLRSVLRDQPNSTAVMRQLASAYRANGELDLAEQTLRNSSQLSPKDADTQLELAQVLAESGKLDQADQVLQPLVKDRSNDLAVQRAVYDLRLRQRDLDGAVVIAKAIQAAHPNQAVGFYLAGVVEESQGDSAAAEGSYERALSIQPQAPDVLSAVTKLDAREKRFDRAEKRLDAQIATYPKDAVAFVLRGNVLAAAGKTGAALTDYSMAVKIAPAWPVAYIALSDSQAAAGKSDEAVKTLRQGMDAQVSNSIDLVSALARLYEKLGKPDDAIALYEAFLLKTPKSSFAQNNLAMLLVTYKSDARDLARAQDLANGLVGSTTVDVIDTRGWVRFKAGDFRGAESLLQQAVDKEPKTAEFRYHLAMAQYRSGEAQRAEQNLETALRANGAFAGVEDARAVLSELKKRG